MVVMEVVAERGAVVVGAEEPPAAAAASSLFRVEETWVIVRVLELIWRVFVAAIAWVCERRGRAPAAVVSRAFARRRSRSACAAVAASSTSVALVVVDNGRWVVAVRRVDGGRDWESDPVRSTSPEAPFVACWRDDACVTVAHGARVFHVSSEQVVVVVSEASIIRGTAVGVGYFDSGSLWVATSDGTLFGPRGAKANVGWPVKLAQGSTGAVMAAGADGAFGVWRFADGWVPERSVPPAGTRRLGFDGDWLALLDATPPLHLNFEEGVVGAVAETLVARRAPCVAAPLALLRGGGEAVGPDGGFGDVPDGVVDAAVWKDGGYAVATPDAVFLVRKDGVVSPIDDGDDMPFRRVVAVRNVDGKLVAARADASVVVCEEASLARLASRASSLAEAIALMKAHGGSERAAREARWRASKDVEALRNVDADDEEALRFAIDASEDDDLQEAETIGAVLDAGDAALAQLTRLRGPQPAAAARLLDLRRRLDLYEKVKKPEARRCFVDMEFPSEFFGWRAFRTADDLPALLARVGVVVAEATPAVLDSIPETASPATYAWLLPKDARWVARRAREMDAVAGQIGNAEKLLALAPETDETLHRDAWQLARLAFTRGTGLALTSLASWESLTTREKILAALRGGAAAAAPLVSGKFAYPDAAEALTQICADSPSDVAVAAVECAGGFASLVFSRVVERFKFDIDVLRAVADAVDDPSLKAQCEIRVVLAEYGVASLEDLEDPLFFSDGIFEEEEVDDARVVVALAERCPEPRRFFSDVDLLAGLWPSEDVRPLARRAMLARLLLRGEDDELMITILEQQQPPRAKIDDDVVDSCARKLLRENPLAEAPRLERALRRNYGKSREAILGFALAGGVWPPRYDDEKVVPEARCALSAIDLVVRWAMPERPAMDDSSLGVPERLRAWAQGIVLDAGDPYFDDEDDAPLAVRAAALSSRATTESERLAAAAGARFAYSAGGGGNGGGNDAADVALRLGRAARLNPDNRVVAALAVEAAIAACDDSKIPRDARKFVAANALRLRSARTSVLVDAWAKLSTQKPSATLEDLLLAGSGDEALAAALASPREKVSDVFREVEKILAARAAPRVDATLVDEIVALGFSRNAAIRAAATTSALDRGLKWCLEHADDPGVDDDFEFDGERRELVARVGRAYSMISSSSEQQQQLSMKKTTSPPPAKKNLLDEMWDEGDYEALSARLLAAAKRTDAVGLAAADAGVLGASKGDVPRALEAFSKPELVAWIKDRYARETKVAPLKLLCNLAKHYASDDPDLTRRAQRQYLDLASFSRAARRSTTTRDVDAKRLFGDLLEDGDRPRAREEVLFELAKVADAKNAAALAKLAPKFKDPTLVSSDVFELALRNELFACSELEEEEEEEVVARNINDRVAPVVSKLVTCGRNAVDELRAAFRDSRDVLLLRRVLENQRISVHVGPRDLASFEEAAELDPAMAKAAVLDDPDFLSMLERAAAERAATTTKDHLRHFATLLLLLLRGTGRRSPFDVDAVVSKAFGDAARETSTPEALAGLLERSGDDAAVSAVIRALVDAGEGDHGTLASLAKLIDDPSAVFYYGVSEILADWEEVTVDRDDDDNKVELASRVLRARKKRRSSKIPVGDADRLWRLLDFVAGPSDNFSRDDALSSFLLLSKNDPAAADDTLLGATWFDLLAACDDQAFAFLARRGCPRGIDYSATAEAAFLETLPPERATRLGLFSRFADIRRAAAATNNDSSRLADLALRVGAADLTRTLYYDAALAAVSRRLDPDASLFDSPHIVVASYLLSARSRADALVACDLAATMMRVHPALRTVDAVLFCCQSAFFDDDDTPRPPGWLHWPDLCAAVQAALHALSPPDR